MQLGFQTIPKPNAQVIETYIGVISRNNRMCTGTCLESVAQNWGELGLGPTPHDPPAAGLAPAVPVAPQPPRISPPPLRLLHVCI